MAFLALGINHKTASVDVRERVAFTPEQMVEALRQLCRVTPSGEAAILSTCNRSELYVRQDRVAGRRRAALAGRLPPTEPRRTARLRLRASDEQQALRHMMQVASGLDSMMLGEPQILGQMKSAYAVAARCRHARRRCSAGCSRHVFSTAKTRAHRHRDRREPGLRGLRRGQPGPADLQRPAATASALLIGAGETIDTGRAPPAPSRASSDIVVANRTLERASELADAVRRARPCCSRKFPTQLVRGDIVISSTASQLPILGKGAVERALKLRKHKPMFMVDIAVPRDIEPQVGELDDVYLYTVDDLHEVVDENLQEPPGRRASRRGDDRRRASTSSWLRLRELDAVRRAQGLSPAGRTAARRGAGKGAAPARQRRRRAEEVLAAAGAQPDQQAAARAQRAAAAKLAADGRRSELLDSMAAAKLLRPRRQPRQLA